MGERFLSTPGQPVTVRGERVLLRDPRPEDVEARTRWLTVETEWGEWDAPWEGNQPLPPERLEEVRQRMLENTSKPPPDPRERLFIQVIDGPLIGWVNHYNHQAAHHTTWVGIDICESDCWGRGLGAEALCLWIDYLFVALDLHRIGAETWSGNERMIRCARKCGFVPEGCFHENIEFRGQRYDSVKLGLLRSEWEGSRR